MGILESLELGHKIKDEFDIFIFVIGWEERCINIINFNSDKFLFQKAIILKFLDNKENAGLKSMTKQ